MSRVPKPQPFWKTKTLAEMTPAEWESLCDGCGKCCLVKLENEDTKELYFTSLSCKMLDAGTCQCSDYPNRKAKVPDCVQLTPEIVAEVDWLPASCAYLLVHQGRDLHDWHHLICGDRDEVHRRGYSAKNRVRSEEGIDDEEAMNYLIDWFHGPPPRRRAKRRRQDK